MKCILKTLRSKAKIKYEFIVIILADKKLDVVAGDEETKATLPRQLIILFLILKENDYEIKV